MLSRTSPLRWHYILSAVVGLIFLTLPASSFSQERLRVSQPNLGLFRQFSRTVPRYTCYAAGETGLLGVINRPKLAVGVWWSKIEVADSLRELQQLREQLVVNRLAKNRDPIALKIKNVTLRINLEKKLWNKCSEFAASISPKATPTSTTPPQPTPNKTTRPVATQTAVSQTPAATKTPIASATSSPRPTATSPNLTATATATATSTRTSSPTSTLTPTIPGTTTPAPTKTTTPTSTPSPRPNNPGASFLGSASSAAKYRNNITEEEIQHLLDKAAFGGNESLRRIGREQGLDALVSALLNGTGTAAENAQFEVDDKFWIEQFKYIDLYDPDKTPIWQMETVQVSYLYRAIYSPHPLQENMLLFWSTHFAVNIGSFGFGQKDYYQYALPQYRMLIAQNALGNVETLTNGFYTDPTMNFWLNNKDNKKSSPNQNFAREIMELFLLGANDPVSGRSNYSEDSVRAATAFSSGFSETATVDPDINEPGISFRYDAAKHESAPFTLFADTAGAGFVGAMTPPQFVHHILYKHPGSARYLADRIGGYFVYPGLPEALVHNWAGVLKQNNFNIKEFLRSVLTSEAMFSLAAQKNCYLSPVEQVVRLAKRVMTTPPPRDSVNLSKSRRLFLDLIADTRRSGQGLFEPQSVFGYKGACNINRAGQVASGEGFLSAQNMFSREKGCINLMRNLSDLGTNFAGALALPLGTTHNQMVQDLAQRLINRKLSVAEEGALANFSKTWLDFDGSRRAVTVSSSDIRFTQSKLPRLICMINDLADAGTR